MLNNFPIDSFRYVVPSISGWVDFFSKGIGDGGKGVGGVVELFARHMKI